jgi:hypothetical protein
MRKHLLVPDKVVNRAGTETGRVVGSGRWCRLEGCGGWRVPVRWPDGRLTWPCSKGMKEITATTWRIQ